MTVFVPEEFVNTELLFYKGTQNQGHKMMARQKSGVRQDYTRLTQYIQVLYIQVSLSFHCPASSLQYSLTPRPQISKWCTRGNQRFIVIECLL